MEAMFEQAVAMGMEGIIRKRFLLKPFIGENLLHAVRSATKVAL
ncbi:MAG: hypothetical protein ABW034_02715 [Steroidobacteraceae bacterium]